MSNQLRIWKKLIFFGDSLTQFGWSFDGCWLAQIADKFQRKYDVINRGFSGYNSKWCNIILPQLFDKSNLDNVAMFAIFIGANDSNVKETNPQQHVPLDEFKIYLHNICTYLMNCGLKKEQILLISPPPVDEEKWELTMKAKNDISSKRLHLCEKYAKTCEAVAHQLNVNYLDLYTKMINQSNWQLLFNDGLHFSNNGSMFVANLLGELLEEKLPITNGNYPLWNEIDNENPYLMLL